MTPIPRCPTNYELTKSIIDKPAQYSACGLSKRMVKEVAMDTSLGWAFLACTYIKAYTVCGIVAMFPLLLQLIDLTHRRFTNKRYGLSFDDKPTNEFIWDAKQNSCIEFFKGNHRSGHSFANRDTALFVFNIAFGIGLGGVAPQYFSILTNPIFLIPSAAVLFGVNLASAVSNLTEANIAVSKGLGYQPC